MAAPNLIWF